MKKIVIFILFIFVIFGGYWGYSNWKGNEDKKTQETLKKEKEKKEKETAKKEPLSLGKTYVQLGENIAYSLTISSFNDKTFEGFLETNFIEDTFSKTNIVSKKWSVKGVQEEGATWNFNLSESKYEQEQVKGTVSNQEIIIKELPILNNPTITLKNDNGFSSNTFKTQLNKTNQSIIQTRKKNVFASTSVKDLPTKLEEQLKQYPKNTDNSLTSTGTTMIYVHTTYLQELSNRLNVNFTKTSEKIKSISDYLKKKNEKNDPHFKDNMQKQFNELLALNDNTQSLLSLYETVVSFYEVPSAERTSSLDLEDEKTSKKYTNFLQTYSSTAIKTYSTKLDSFRQQNDKLFAEFSKKLKVK